MFGLPRNNASHRLAPEAPAWRFGRSAGQGSVHYGLTASGPVESSIAEPQLAGRRKRPRRKVPSADAESADEDVSGAGLDPAGPSPGRGKDNAALAIRQRSFVPSRSANAHEDSAQYYGSSQRARAEVGAKPSEG